MRAKRGRHPAQSHGSPSWLNLPESICLTGGRTDSAQRSYTASLTGTAMGTEKPFRSAAGLQVGWLGMQRELLQLIDPSFAGLINRDQSCGQCLRLIAAVGYLTFFQQLLEYTAEQIDFAGTKRL